MREHPTRTGAPAADAARAGALADRFRAAYGEAPRIYRSPGRVNLIGEHTDYNEGFVLPAALDLAVWVAASLRDDASLVVQSETLGERIAIDLSGPIVPIGGWRDYVAGVASLLRDRGYLNRGATLLIESDVPVGAGLSSSAALEVGVATALVDLADARMDPLSMAALCQRAENEFAGARCGIMDQFVACHGRAGSAVLLDCRSLAHDWLPLPTEIRLVACNSMVRHAVAGGEYGRRRSECEAAVKQLASLQPGLQSLRDATLDLLDEARGRLSDVLFRRARHVIAENARVLRFAEALRGRDLAALGPLMADSHRSLRDDYEVSCAELDTLVALARDIPGVYGSRMTGGGFGGCTVNLVHIDAVREFSSDVAARYEAATGQRPEIYATDAAAAAARVTSDDSRA